MDTLIHLTTGSLTYIRVQVYVCKCMYFRIRGTSHKCVGVKGTIILKLKQTEREGGNCARLCVCGELFSTTHFVKTQ